MNEHADQEYIEAREKLIPAAVRCADERHKDDTDRAGWPRTFMLKMDRLAVETGVQERYLHRQSKAVIKAERGQNGR